MATEKRLIDANAIKYRTQGCGGWGMPENVVSDDEIAKMPTVDAVPVVRCKDCTYGYYAGLGKFMCELHEFVGKGDFYCASGERKDNV